MRERSAGATPSVPGVVTAAVGTTVGYALEADGSPPTGSTDGHDQVLLDFVIILI